MRIAKVNHELTEKHGKYAEVIELLESPRGYQARVKFGDGHRATIPVTKLRMVQPEGLPRSTGGWF
jgi:hypothetical protein